MSRLVKVPAGMNYEEITIAELNNAVPGLLLFTKEENKGKIKSELPVIVNDIYNMFRVYQHHIDNGTLSKFSFFELLDNDKIMATRHDVEVRKHVGLLLSIPLHLAYGITAIDKVANLLFNIKIFELDLIFEQTIDIRFRGYESYDQVQKLVSDNGIINTRTSDSKYVLLTGNIRENLCDLSPSFAIALYDKEMPTYDDLDPINIPIVLMTSHFDKIIEEKVDSSALALKAYKDRESEEVISFRATKASDLKKVRVSDLGRGNLAARLVKGDLAYRDRVSYKGPKQIIVIGCDDSGSMDNVIKQTRIKTIMAAILAKVIDNRAEVSFSYYGANIKNTMEATDKESALELRDRIFNNKSREGGTDIGASIQTLVDRVTSTDNLKEPHVIIILDGDDVVDASKVNTKGAKISAFLLGQTNKGVEELVSRTGGFVVIDDLYTKFKDLKK